MQMTQKLRLVFIVLFSCVLTACAGLGDGILLQVSPVSWCMEHYDYIKNESERRKYCEGEFMASRNGAKAQAQAQALDEKEKQDSGLSTTAETLQLLAQILQNKGNNANTMPAGRIESNNNASSASSSNALRQQNSISSTQNQSSNGLRTVEAANQCVSINRVPGNWATMRNSCPYDIEVAWCYVGGDCKNGSWGASNLGTIRANDTRSASTFTSHSSNLGLHFLACKGRNTSPREVDATTYQCFE